MLTRKANLVDFRAKKARSSGDCFYLDPGIPVGEKVITCIGVCFVQFDEQGKIRRNEVYFDRTELVAEIYRLRNEAGAKGR